MLLFLLGCPSPADTEPADHTDTPDTQVQDTTPPVDTSPCPTQVASMSGTVIPADGGSPEGMRVNLCRTVCKFIDLTADGTFTYPEFEAGDCSHALSVVDLTGRPYMTPLTMVHAQDGEVREDVVLTVPVVEQSTPIPATGAQELDLCGVHVTMATDQLELPFGEDGDVATCARVSPQLWLPWDGVAGEVQAVWYLGPYDAEGALPYWITNDLGLPDGTYQAWAADYDDHVWVSAGALTVAGDRIDSDSPLPVLSTLVIAR